METTDALKNNAEALLKEGQALHRRRQLAEAEEKYREALALDRGLAPLCMLAAVLGQTGRLEESASIFEEALAVEANSFEIHREYAGVLQALCKYEKAADHFERSLELFPNQPVTLFRLFELLTARQKGDRIARILDAALARNPNDPLARHLLANLHLYRGDTAAALAEIRKAIALEPDNPLHYRVLGQLKVFERTDPDLAAMEALFRKLPSDAVDERIALSFAIAKAYADIGADARSFHMLTVANSLMDDRVTYDRAKVRGEVEFLKSTYTPAVIRDLAGAGDATAAPIFIIGMPRSGTTLIEQILSSHPQVASTGENTAFPRAVFNIAPDYLNGPPVSAEKIAAIARTYLESNEDMTGGKPRTIDKMLGNLGHTPLIHLAFPNAKIIHVVRDPVDVCLSCFATKFSGLQQEFAYNLENLGAHYAVVEDLMTHWRETLPEGVVMTVAYEDVVADLKGATERMLAHCGLPWDDACLEFTKTAFVNTASASQVRQPIHNKSVGRWRPDASVLEPLMDALGPYAKRAKT